MKSVAFQYHQMHHVARRNIHRRPGFEDYEIVETRSVHHFANVLCEVDMLSPPFVCFCGAHRTACQPLAMMFLMGTIAVLNFKLKQKAFYKSAHEKGEKSWTFEGKK